MVQLVRYLAISLVLTFTLAVSLFAAELSFELVKERAEAGNASAQAYLGVMYREGEGVEQDEREAAKWFRKAAYQGHALAQGSLAVMYLGGMGVPKNDVEAYAWFNLAAVSDDTAKNARDKLNLTLTPDEKARAQKRSKELFDEIEARKKAAGK
jgi:TPR repeat protein